MEEAVEPAAALRQLHDQHGAAVLVAVLGGLAGWGLRTLTYQPPEQRLAFSAVVPSPR